MPSSTLRLNETIPSGTIHHDIQASIVVGHGYNFQTNSQRVYIEIERGDYVVYIWLENEEVIDIAKELHERAITLRERESAVTVVDTVIDENLDIDPFTMNRYATFDFSFDPTDPAIVAAINIMTEEVNNG